MKEEIEMKFANALNALEQAKNKMINCIIDVVAESSHEGLYPHYRYTDNGEVFTIKYNVNGDLAVFNEKGVEMYLIEDLNADDLKVILLMLGCAADSIDK